MSILSFTKTRILPILLVNFLGILGYSLVLPILIFIVSDFGGNGFIYGLIGATYPFFQFIGAPKLGRLSDRIGRKKVLIITQLGSFLSWMLFVVAFLLPNILLWKFEESLFGSFSITIPLVLLFIARMIDGYTGGNISVANAYMADISTDEDRSKNFGLIGSSTSLGLAVGPAVSALLAATALGVLLPLSLAAAMALITAIIINARLRESQPCIDDKPVELVRDIRQLFQGEHRDCYEDKNNGEGKESQLSEILKIKGIPVLFLIYFLVYLAFNLFYVSIPIYVSKYLNWTVVELGGYLAYFSFVMILVQGPVLTLLAKKLGSSILVLIGASLLSFGFALLVAQGIWMLYIAVTIMALGNGIMWPSFLSILSKKGSEKIRGVVQGYGASMGSMASIIGLVLGGILFEYIGVFVFALGAGLFLLIATTWLVHHSKVKKSSFLGKFTNQ